MTTNVTAEPRAQHVDVRERYDLRRLPAVEANRGPATVVPVKGEWKLFESPFKSFWQNDIEIEFETPRIFRELQLDLLEDVKSPPIKKQRKEAPRLTGPVMYV